MEKGQIKFTDWLAERLGTRRWAVCRASARRREKYDLFLSSKRYDELEAEFKSQRAEVVT